MATRQDPPRSGRPTKAATRQSARERMAAHQAAERRRERMRWITMWTITGVLVAVLLGFGVWAFMGQHSKASRPAALPTQAQQGSETALPPWPLPADPVSGARAAGLNVAPMEGTARHFHAHLDILVNGQAVPVAADLGVSAAQQAMSELHTHDTRGVIHIESPAANKRYTLGQLFDEWQVKLTATGIGGLKTDATHTLTAYVNGKQWTGDPAAIELTPHREIALVYGPAGAKVDVSKSYKFQPSE
jgi:hypothetical protein